MKVCVCGEELIYRLDPRESVLVGIGFVTQMPFPMFYRIEERSGLSTHHCIEIQNASVVDSDYRGEAGVLLHNRGEKPFYLKHGMRIAQILFQWAVIPELQPTEDLDSMDKTKRGTQGFGSTGI